MEVHSWTDLIDAILRRKIAFLMAFFFVFLSTYSVLSWLDFLPELVKKEDRVQQVEVLPAPVPTEVLSVVTSEPVVVAEIIPTIEEPVEEASTEPVFPTLISIPALDTEITVLNPASRDVAKLDAALLEGVVRHPDSATLEQSGTVFILGHSSYLPAVRNKNFQAFNGIQNLKWGDTVVLTSAEGEYIYRVEKVYRAKAGDVTVPIAGPTQRLVLATCNSFGSQDDRYIVEADLLKVTMF